jgi:hypothetical protein
MQNNNNSSISKSTVTITGHRDSLARRVLGQLVGQRGPAPGGLDDRRLDVIDRRRLTVRSIMYGALHPRRKELRRDYNEQLQVLDWHDSKLMYLALAIVLMSCADALFTLNLLAVGAEEMNILMRALISSDVNQFLVVKIGATCISVVVLVAASEYRFLGRYPVRVLLYSFCLIYAVLLTYQIYLLMNYAQDVITMMAWPLIA